MASKDKKVKKIDIFRGNDATIKTFQDLVNQGLPINKVPTGTGLYNSSVNSTPFVYNKPSSAREIKKKDAAIVMGQVPYATSATGYGAQGLSADSIDIVVGRNASSYGGKGPKKNSIVENNFASDAARIYITKLCDIDSAFGLVSNPRINDGKGSVARSAIGMKADAVRVVGREGVKITTGKMDNARFGIFGETNSLGGDIGQAPKIELIAGNNYDNVQGVGLGENIVDCFNEIIEIISQMWGSVYNATKSQMEFNSVLGISPLPHFAAGGPFTTLRQGVATLAPLYHSRVNMLLGVQSHYLRPSGGKYIASRHVKTN
jgi:hypothetical protein